MLDTHPPLFRPRRQARHHRVVLGIATAAAALAAGASWSVAALCALDIAAPVSVIWVWANIAGADAHATARIVRAEDASRTAAEAVLISAGAASLLAVVFMLAQAGRAHAPRAARRYRQRCQVIARTPLDGAPAVRRARSSGVGC
jgi:uncharacterized membrane protein